MISSENRILAGAALESKRAGVAQAGGKMDAVGAATGLLQFALPVKQLPSGPSSVRKLGQIHAFSVLPRKFP